MSRLTIGQLGKATDTKAPTIRYYEQIGMLAAPPRTIGNQRRYGEAEVQRLAFIRHARQLGFPLESVRELLGLADQPHQRCEAANTLAKRHLDDVQRRIASLTALKEELARMVVECHGGEVKDCRVIEVLSDHRRCLSQTHGETV